MIAKTLVRRLSLMIFVLLGLTVITFAISRLIPTDPARLVAGDYASEEVVEQIRVELGFDQPLWTQFFLYLQDLASLDLGTSLATGQPVLSDLAQFAPATVELAAFAMLLATLGGVGLGIAAALYKDRWPDQVIRLFAMGGVSMPSFWLALVLVIAFYGNLGILPSGGRIDPALADFDRVTGFYLIDTLMAGQPAAFFSALAHIVLPAVCLAIINMGAFARLIRTSLLEEVGKPYVTTLKSMGLSRRRIIYAHVLRNAITPFVTQLGLAFAAMLTGAVVTEAIFGWPGMGGYILQATESLDFPAIMGFTLVVGVVYAVMNLVIDLAYLAIDPRLRRQG